MKCLVYFITIIAMKTFSIVASLSRLIYKYYIPNTVDAIVFWCVISELELPY